LTTHDRFSYDPAWSPAGDQIAFVARGDNDEIYLINADGSDLRRLTTNTWEWDKHPSWSPDGKQIVFWSNRDSGRRQFWVMNADGSNQRPLLASTYNDWDPIWVK
jgi:TolB protein